MRFLRPLPLHSVGRAVFGGVSSGCLPSLFVFVRRCSGGKKDDGDKDDGEKDDGEKK